MEDETKKKDQGLYNLYKLEYKKSGDTIVVLVGAKNKKKVRKSLASITYRASKTRNVKKLNHYLLDEVKYNCSEEIVKVNKEGIIYMYTTPIESND